MNEEIILTVSEFVALFNQTIEFAFSSVVLTGELANFKVSKNRWVYFDLKDEESSVKFFGTVYQLPGPLEDGLLIKVRGQPRLHNLYGFSVNIINIQLAGEGSIKKAASLLQQKLANEGLFDKERKRALPYPPKNIGLIASKQSAAYSDFIKILNARWTGLDIDLVDVQVQGEIAPKQIIEALELLNEKSTPPDAIVIIRGGGSAEDLAAFNTEQVTRAVASSRVPTIVAIGHEIDISLAELAADLRGSTPSNAAELLVPDKSHVSDELNDLHMRLNRTISQNIDVIRKDIKLIYLNFNQSILSSLNNAKKDHRDKIKLLHAFNPDAVLNRGYSIVRGDKGIIRNSKDVKVEDIVSIKLSVGELNASVKNVKL